MCPRSIAGVPSSQALLGYLITAPPSVCIPTVIGALTVWFQNQKINKKWDNTLRDSMQFDLSYAGL